MTTKAELRKIYLNERLSLSDVEYAQLNYDISENFFSHIDLSKIKVLHSFIPMENTKEPNTWTIINRIKKQFPDIRISIPRINVQTIEIENFYFEEISQLKTNPWGIPEPQHGMSTKTGDIEMVLVPMLVADQQGHRVGYGKGFYDKFLSTCRPSCKRVGLCFSEPIPRISDVTPLDVPLHYCVTPIKVHQF